MFCDTTIPYLGRIIFKMELHPQFRLNGTAYSNDSLLAAANKWQSAADSEQKELGLFLEAWLTETDTLTIHTSGSTGTPKKMEVSKTAMRASAKRTAAFFELAPGDTALLCLPIQYIAGKMMLVRAMVIGLDLDLISPKTALQLQGKKYDFAALIPLQASASFELLGSLKTILIGGAQIAVALRKALAKKHPHCIETYGMTETLTHVATRPVSDPPVPFVAMPDIGIAVDSDSCLVLTVPYISKIPIGTNDAVELVTERSFHLLGRRDFVINSGGKKIFPEQLEEKLADFLDSPFFFAGVPDAALGERLVLILAGDSKEKQAAMEIATQVLGADKHHVPKEVVRVDAFVHTQTGKLDRIATLKKVLR